MSLLYLLGLLGLFFWNRDSDGSVSEDEERESGFYDER